MSLFTNYTLTDKTVFFECLIFSTLDLLIFNNLFVCNVIADSYTEVWQDEDVDVIP